MTSQNQSKNKYPANLFQGFSKDDREAAIALLKYSPFFERLRELVSGMKKTSSPDYDCPSWSHRQAHDNGVNEACDKFLKFITKE